MPIPRRRLVAFAVLATLLAGAALELVLAPFAPTGFVAHHLREWDEGRFYVLDVDGAPRPSPLPRRKAPGEIRVFTFGGSSTHGNPYSWDVSFPRFLSRILADWYPDRRIRVINLGYFARTASDSVDWAREALAFEPDYFVFYSGHNEIYPWNLAAVRHPRRFSVSWRLRDVLLRRSHTAAALNGLVAHFTRQDGTRQDGTPEGDGAPPSGPRPEEEWGFVLANYRRNLDELLAMTPPSTTVYLGLPVANLRSWSPLAQPSLPDDATELYLDLLRRTERGEEIPCDAATREQVAAWRGDPAFYAVASFWLGRCGLAEGRRELGKKLLRDAAVADSSTGRVHPAILELLRSRHLDPPNAKVIDFEALFEARSPYGVVGHEWFLDWCHPSDEAHLLMALEIAQRIVRERAELPVNFPLEPPRPPRDYLEEIRAASGSSEEDAAMHSLLWRQLDNTVRVAERVEARGLETPRLLLAKALAHWEMEQDEAARAALADALERTSVAEADEIVRQFFGSLEESWRDLLAAEGLKP